jgi:acyl-CoA synthetase (AMP-forming)/AMP-acid ligase II
VDLTDVLDMAVERYGNRVAVSDGTSDLTYPELFDAAQRAAGQFLAQGAQRVAYFGVNGRAAPLALFAAAMAGLPYVPLNYRLSDDALGGLFERMPGAVVMVATEAERARLEELGVDSVTPLDTLIGAGSERSIHLPEPDADRAAVVLFTSGTTAAPKAVVLTHRNLTTYLRSAVGSATARREQSALVAVPPYHVAGVVAILSNIYSGRRIVYLEPFSGRGWLDAVRGERVTHAMVVPTMLERIVGELGDGIADTPSLRSVVYGGAKASVSLIERALRAFPDVYFTNSYGLTETSATITLLGPADHREALASEDPTIRARLGSAGRPVPGVEIAVFDERGNPCPTGVAGDIHVRGPQVSGEYEGRPRRDPRDWFPTRDRGFLDRDGYVFVEGRADDTIIRGGENIAPAEIEDVLLRHPDVAECAVVGIPDPEWGQAIAAVVVLQPSSCIEPDDLREWVRTRLRGSKTPALIARWNALPYTDTGKVLRRAVATQLASQPTSGSGAPSAVGVDAL